MNKLRRKFSANDLRLVSRIKPDSLKEETRTVDITFSTGARGRRNSIFGSYYEELEISEKAIDLTRLNSGGPVLAAHDSSDLDKVIGVVERAWIDGNEAKATIRFADDEFSDRIWKKVKSGILRNISVGYDPQYEEVTSEDDDLPVYRAVRWEPYEVSIVPIGFDAAAQVRSKDELKPNQVRELEIVKTKEEIKTEDLERSAELNDKNETKKEELETKREENNMSDKNTELQKAVEAERQRCLEIRELVGKLDLSTEKSEEMAKEYISRNASIEEVKTNIELFKKYTQENTDNKVRSTQVEISTKNADERREGIVEAILHQNDSSFKVTERAKQFVGSSLLKNLERHMERRPIESDSEFVKRVMTSSDLPHILANVAEKTAQRRYQLAPKTFEAWTSKGTLRNFKESMQVRGGDVGELLKIDEAGEYKESSIGEERETAKLEKYGIIHSFSDIMLINDDLDMILKIAQEAGVAQARLDNRLAYQALISNPVMSDGKNLFSADHKNLGTPDALGETSVSEARKAMRKQRSVDGRDVLNVAPRFLLVGPELETMAQKFLSLINPTKTDDVNIFSRSLDLIVDAEITDSSYYFVADPSLVEGVKVNRLAGQETIKVESRTNWRNDAIELKLKYAVQAKAIDYRGLFKNEGDEE
jgi:hypothetical protein